MGVSHAGVWKGISGRGSSGPSPEAGALRVGWNNSEAGTDHAGLAGLVLALALL